MANPLFTAADALSCPPRLISVSLDHNPMSESTIEVEFSESPIPDGTFRRTDEVTIKRDGCVWRIHRNDPDPFPSQPHAHNLESGLKLDLSNGELYFRGRNTGKRISNK